MGMQCMHLFGEPAMSFFLLCSIFSIAHPGHAMYAPLWGAGHVFFLLCSIFLIAHPGHAMYAPLWGASHVFVSVVQHLFNCTSWACNVCTSLGSRPCV